MARGMPGCASEEEGWSDRPEGQIIDHNPMKCTLVTWRIIMAGIIRTGKPIGGVRFSTYQSGSGSRQIQNEVRRAVTVQERARAIGKAFAPRIEVVEEPEESFDEVDFEYLDTIQNEPVVKPHRPKPKRLTGLTKVKAGESSPSPLMQIVECVDCEKAAREAATKLLRHLLHMVANFKQVLKGEVASGSSTFQKYHREFSEWEVAARDLVSNDLIPARKSVLALECAGIAMARSKGIDLQTVVFHERMWPVEVRERMIPGYVEEVRGDEVERRLIGTRVV
jgi:hypothetical protein